jgi:hypothetical protein
MRWTWNPRRGVKEQGPSQHEDLGPNGPYKVYTGLSSQVGNVIVRKNISFQGSIVIFRTELRCVKNGPKIVLITATIIFFP